MRESHFVIFQAVDKPLNDDQLEFAKRQLTRADITRWTLKIENQQSSLRGDVDGWLRRGFDIFLQFDSYGDLSFKWRLPSAPFSFDIWSRYVDGERLQWQQDADGPSGILSLHPFRESGERHYSTDVPAYLEVAIRVRERLLTGDLRALYLLWLCASFDDNTDPEETIEPPVPHGIADFAAYGGALASIFGLDCLTLVAVGEGVEAAPKARAERDCVERWIESLDERHAKKALANLLAADTMVEKARLLADVRQSQHSPAWPTSDRRRTMTQILQATGALRQKENARRAAAQRESAKINAEKAEQKRVERLRQLSSSPETYLQQVDQLVDASGRRNFIAAVELLAEIRDAVGGDPGRELTSRHAAKIVARHPTQHELKGKLKKGGFIIKRPAASKARKS